MKPNQPEDLKSGVVHQSTHFGLFEIVNYTNYRNVYVQFLGTGFIRKTTGKHIREGSVRDPFMPAVFGVGFNGAGKYKTKIKGEKQKGYQTWCSMLERCYSPKYHERSPSYSCCTVRSDWHNYQAFAEWFYNNYPDSKERVELDKDIKIDGNKEYSKDACMFVTQKENSTKANSKSYSFTSPAGERVDIYNLSEFCRVNGLQGSKMSAVNNGKRNYHKGWTRCQKQLD